MSKLPININSVQGLKDGLIDFRMLKTGGRATPPLYKKSEEILSMYEGRPPRIPNPVFNLKIKELFLALKIVRPFKVTKTINRTVTQKMMPLYEAVSAYVARKSFITIALSKGIPIQDVMHMS